MIDTDTLIEHAKTGDSAAVRQLVNLFEEMQEKLAQKENISSMTEESVLERVLRREKDTKEYLNYLFNKYDKAQELMDNTRKLSEYELADYMRRKGLFSLHIQISENEFCRKMKEVLKEEDNIRQDIFNNAIIVTKYSALVDYIHEVGLASTECEAIEYVNSSATRNKHIIGIVPLRTAARAKTITYIPLRIPEDRRGKELHIEEIRELAGKPIRYTINVEKIG